MQLYSGYSWQQPALYFEKGQGMLVLTMHKSSRNWMEKQRRSTYVWEALALHPAFKWNEPTKIDWDYKPNGAAEGLKSFRLTWIERLPVEKKELIVCIIYKSKN